MNRAWRACFFQMDWNHHIGNFHCCLLPETSTFKWLFLLDDSKLLHEKLLFHQASVKKNWWLGYQAFFVFWVKCQVIFTPIQKNYPKSWQKNIHPSFPRRELRNLNWSKGEQNIIMSQGCTPPCFLHLFSVFFTNKNNLPCRSTMKPSTLTFFFLQLRGQLRKCPPLSFKRAIFSLVFFWFGGRLGPDSRATAPGIPRNGMNLQKKQVLQQNFASRVCGFLRFVKGFIWKG